MTIPPHVGSDPPDLDWQEKHKNLIPQEPDPDRMPELNKAWHRLFSESVSFERAEPEKVRPKQTNVAGGVQSYQEIGNWCGAMIAPGAGSQFIVVFGEWTVPVLSKPPQSLRPPDDRASYHCTTWIGFDGDRRYFNSSLPQVGTEQILMGNGTETCSAWFQWWARDQVTLTACRLPSLRIKAGMTIRAMIWAYQPNEVSVAVRVCAPKAGKDQQDKLTIFSYEAPEVYLPGRNDSRAHPEIAGATAEWIVERPQTHQLENASFLPFPAHEPVKFSNCVAGLAPIISEGDCSARKPRQACSEKLLVRPRLIRLFEPVSDETGARTRLLSLAQQSSETSIEVRYCGNLTTPREMAELAIHSDLR